MTHWHCHRCDATFADWAGAADHADHSGHGHQALTLRSRSELTPRHELVPTPLQVQVW
jgi:hypothetical protein